MKITVAPRVWTATVDQNGRIKLATLGVQGPPGPPGAKASQAQAEAGTDDATYMTPLKTAQAVAAAPVSTATTTAITAAVAQAVDDLLNGAPAALDTLKELADALGDDANFAATMTAALAGKLAKASNLSDLASIATALVNLGLDQVDNTRDANKPVSTAQATALNLKLDKAGGLMTGPLQLGANKVFGQTQNATDAWLQLTTAGGAQLGYGTSFLEVGGPLLFGTVSLNAFRLTAQGAMSVPSGGMVGWSSSANTASGIDTALSRGGAGQVNVGNGTAGDASGTLSMAKLLLSPAGYVGVNDGGNAKFGFINDNIPALLGVLGDLRFNTDASFGLGGNFKIYADGANVWAQRNGAAAQTLRLYNTADATSGAPTNYERFELQWSGNALRLGTFNGGTGAARRLYIVTDNNNRWFFETTGDFLPTTSGSFNIGSATLPVRSINLLQAQFAAVPVASLQTPIAGFAGITRLVNDAPAGVAWGDAVTVGGGSNYRRVLCVGASGWIYQ